MNDSELTCRLARTGKAIALDRGQSIEIVNTRGSQVIDTWAFNRSDSYEYMSMEHTRSFNSRVCPKAGDAMVSNRRRAILTLTEDTSPGVHDTVLCACNRYIYEELGCVGHHRNGEDNLHEALSEQNIEIAFTPAPLNLFMNTPIVDDGAIERHPPTSSPGDHVTLRAEMDLLLVLSACPHDISPINGAERMPMDVHFRIQ